MNSLTQYDNEFVKNSIKYLHNISILPQVNTPALKSIYSTKRRLLELRQNVFLPSNLNRSSVRCQRCHINLLDGPASYRIKPEHGKSRFNQKVLTKNQTNKPLTKYQRKYLTKMSNFNRNRNQLVITCKFCKKESFIKLEKPAKLPKVKISNTSSQKKKRKKDKFCGLNQDVILSLSSQNCRSLDIFDNEVSGSNAPKLKMKKKDSPQLIKTTPPLEQTKENRNKIKKKKNSLGKLNEYLNNSYKSKNSHPAKNLHQFLESL